MHDAKSLDHTNDATHHIKNSKLEVKYIIFTFLFLHLNIEKIIKSSCVAYIIIGAFLIEKTAIKDSNTITSYMLLGFLNF